VRIVLSEENPLFILRNEATLCACSVQPHGATDPSLPRTNRRPAPLLKLLPFLLLSRCGFFSAAERGGSGVPGTLRAGCAGPSQAARAILGPRPHLLGKLPWCLRLLCC